MRQQRDSQNQRNGLNKQNSDAQKRQKASSYSLREYLKQYYLKDFHRVIGSTYRPFGMALIIMTVYYLQLISLLFPQVTVDFIRENDELMYGIQQVFDQFKGWNILSTIFNIERPWEYILLFQTALNTSILILIFIGIIYYGYNRNNNIQHTNSRVIMFFRLSEVYTSFVFSIYTFIFHMPFQHSNLKILFDSENSDQLFRVLALLNIPSTILIGVTGLLHDFSYSYKPKDALAGDESIMGLFTFAQEFILCLLTQADVSWILWAIFVVIHSRLIFYIFNIPFYNPAISQIHFSFILTKWILWFTNILFEIRSVRDTFNMSFIVIGCIPLFWKIPSYFYKTKINHTLFGQSSQDVSEKNIELYCRILAQFVDLDQYEYMKEAKGMTFEMVYVDHITSCTQKQCFCNEFRNTTDKINFSSSIQLFDQKKRFEFLCFLIIETYSDFFRRNQRQLQTFQKLQYSYLHFIIEVMHIPTKSFVEVVTIRNILKKNSASLKEQFIIESLMRLANTEFSNFWEKSEIQNQRLDMMSVIDFSDLNCQIGKNLKQILNLKKDLLLFLSTDYIDLNQLIAKGQQFVQQRDQLEKQISDVFDINPHSKQSYFYAEIYCENFDIRQRKIYHFIKNSKLKLLKQLRKEDLGINIFRQKSCMVYITLLNPIGFIKRVSTSFEQLFGVKQIYQETINFFKRNQTNLSHLRFGLFYYHPYSSIIFILVYPKFIF